VPLRSANCSSYLPSLFCKQLGDETAVEYRYYRGISHCGRPLRGWLRHTGDIPV